MEISGHRQNKIIKVATGVAAQGEVVMETLTKGQEEFVDQMTRKLMVDWCLDALTSGSTDIPDDYFAHLALKKKWITAAPVDVSVISLGRPITVRILSAGWDTAARFLKR